MIMPPRERRPRPNPLIPVDDKPFASSDVAGAPEPMLIDSPICGQHWPDGWASLGDGDYASCEHGEWSKKEAFVPRAAATGPEVIPSERQPYSAVLNGVTTDGIPVTITLRPGELALVALADDPMVPASVFLDGRKIAEVPVPAGAKLADLAPASPFAPKAVEIDPAELNAGEDVMFMPSGG
jgi:hypothetical protein